MLHILYLEKFQNKMKKVKRICTIQDCIKKAHYIYYNYYVTELLMHKQGVVYDMKVYQKKMKKRLKAFFVSLKKVIEKTEKEEIIKILKKKREDYLHERRTVWDLVRGYSPESVTLVEIRVAETMLWERIRAMLAEESFAYKNLKEIFEIECYLAEKSFTDYRQELQDYGYVPRKKKVVRN